MSVLSLLQAPWAIQPEKLMEIQAVYATHCRGETIDLEALEARMGRPLASDQQDYVLREGGVAVLAIDGVLAPKANLFMRISGGSSTAMMRQQVESAGADPRVKALVLEIDSPGGSVHGSPELAATVAEIAQIKPVVAIATANIASAAYWVGSAANAVYLTGPTVLAGSIGIVATHDYSPRAPGRAVTEITAGRYKRIASGNEPLSAEGRAYMQAQVDHLYSVFVETVAQNRGATAEQVLEHMADGRVFVGQQAIDAGLADGITSLDALVESLATDPAKHASRRKAVFAVPAGSPSKGAVPAPKDKPPTREKGASMPDTLTRASFEQEHAALFAQVRAEFTASGAAEERNRIQAVLAVGDDLPGHEALLNGLAFDGKTTAGEASLAVVKAEGAQRIAAINAHAADAPQPAKPSTTPADPAGGVKTRDQQLAEAKAYAKEKGIGLTASLKELGFAR